MSEGLEFELSVSQRKALRQIEDFVAEADRRLSALRFDPMANSSYAKMQQQSAQAVAQVRRQEEALTATVQREAAKRTAIERKAAADRAAVERAAGGSSRFGSKGMTAAFQLQQAVEDFSYAGVRGASNNVAFLASQLGGAGGLIALAGLTATAFIGMGRSLYDWIDTSDDAAKSNLELAGSFIETAEAREKFRAELTKNPIDTVGELTEAGRDQGDDSDELRQRLKLTQQLAAAVTGMRQARNATAGDGWGQWWQNTVDFRGRADAELKRARAAMDRGRETFPGLPSEKTIRNADAEDFDAMMGRWEDALKRRRDEESKLLTQIHERKRAIEDAGNVEKNALERIRAKYEVIGGIQNKARFDAMGPLQQELHLLTEKQSRLLKTSEDERRTITERSQALREYEADLWKVRHLERRINEDKETARNLEEEIRNLRRDEVDRARDNLQAVKDRNRELQRAIDLETKRVEKLTEAAEQNRQSFGDKSFDLIRDRTRDFTSRQAERAKQLDRMANPLISALGPNQEVRKFRDAQIDAWFAAVGEARDRALQRMRQDALSMELEAAKARAERPGAKTEDHERHREALERLQDHHFQRAQEAIDPARAQAHFAEAQRIHGLIEKSFQTEAQASQNAANNLQQQIQHVGALEARLRDAEAAARSVPDVDPVKNGAIEKARQLAEELRNAAAAAQMSSLLGGGPGGGGLPGLAGGIGGLFGRAGLGGLFGGFRADGGPVERGSAYVVGERGPELFVPRTPGDIIDARASRDYLNAIGAGAAASSGAVSRAGANVTHHVDQSSTRWENIIHVEKGADVPDLFAMMEARAKSNRLRSGAG